MINKSCPSAEAGVGGGGGLAEEGGKRAIMFKKLGHKNGRSLTTDIFLKIVDIKNNINKSRTNFEGYVLSNDMINKNWLVGFIEGDGTFHFSKNNKGV